MVFWSKTLNLQDNRAVQWERDIGFQCVHILCVVFFGRVHVYSVLKIPSTWSTFVVKEFLCISNDLRAAVGQAFAIYDYYISRSDFLQHINIVFGQILLIMKMSQVLQQTVFVAYIEYNRFSANPNCDDVQEIQDLFNNTLF